MKRLRSSKQRQMILEAVKARHDHPTADQIYIDVRKKNTKISKGTVYRNLGILAANEEILNVKVSAADRYDSRCDYHYHAYCISCGKTFDVPLNYNPQYDNLVEKETGFKVKRHRLIFEGLCCDCMKDNKYD